MRTAEKFDRTAFAGLAIGAFGMTALEGEHEHLPIAALLAFAMTGFTAILNETLPAGLLPQIAGGLHVSEALGGQLVTSYAAGSLIAVIPLMAATQSYRRKPVFLSAIFGLLLFNTITAVSTSYALTIAARFMAGVSAGLAWGILAGYARRMVVNHLKGKALAIAMVGTPIALSIGVPLGALLGTTLGWRTIFLGMSGSTVILILWVMWKVPDYPGQPADKRHSFHQVLFAPGVRPILAVTFAWMTAHNILYTYIAPLAVLSGIQGRVELLLLAFGLAALAGIWVTGTLIDRMLRRLVLSGLFAFGLVALALGVAGSSPVVAVLGVIVWGLSFGGAATQILTAIADASGDGVDLANALVTTVWNTAIAAGGIFGGMLLDRWGATSFAWTVLMLAAIAFAIAWTSRRHAFRPGRRA